MSQFLKVILQKYAYPAPKNRTNPAAALPPDLSGE